MASAATAAIGSSGVGQSSSHNLTPIMFSINVNQNASAYAASQRRGAPYGQQDQQQANQPKRTLRERFVAFFKGDKPKVTGDPLDYDISLPSRYVPTSIEALVERTKFTRAEVKRLYCAWKQFCPYGLIDKEQFIACFSDLYPYGNCRSYAARVFDALVVRNDAGNKPVQPPPPSQQPSPTRVRTTAVILSTSFDVEQQAETKLIPEIISPPVPQRPPYDYNDEEITFESFIMFLSCVLRGSDEQKLEWCFQLYDRDNKGRLTQKNVVDFVFSIYQLVNEEPAQPSPQYDLIYREAVRAYQKLDVNKKGSVTRGEFIAVCMHDDVIRQSLQVFDTII